MSRMDRIATRACPDHGLGHAIVSVTGQDLPGQGCVVVIQQGSGAGRQTLGAQGWQSSEARLTPLEVRPVTGGVDIVLGPDVVQHLKPGNYRLRLSDGTRTTEDKGFSWTVPPYRPARRPVTAPPAATAAAPPAPGPRMEATLGSAVAPEVVHEPPPGPKPKVEIPPEPKPTPEPEPEPEPVAAEPSAAPNPLAETRRPLPMLPIAVVLGVVILAVAGWSWWQQRDRGDIAATATPLPAAEAPVVEPPDDDAEALARRMVADNASPASLRDLGRELLAEGQVGAALLLLRRAGDGGDAEALVVLGRLFDPSPAGQPVEGGPAADARSALTLYQRAEGLRPGAARPALADLAAWATAQAAAGDADAMMLLPLLSIDN